jgi:hypothetical protein
MYLILLYNKILDSCFLKKDPSSHKQVWNEQFANNIGVRRRNQPLLNSLKPENIQVQSITTIAPADLLFL